MTPADQSLPGGGALRVYATHGPTVLLLGGSSYREGPGRWSAAMDWLGPRLADAGWRTAQVRYPSRSWREMRSAADAVREAALRLDDVRALVGFSLGGGAAISAAPDVDVGLVVGLAPWMPEEVDLSALDGRRFRVLHGSLDRPLPGIPGIRPAHSLEAVGRAKRRGVDATHRLVPGGIHLIAFRAFGRLFPAPRAGRWCELIVDALGPAQP